jgi:hypothetical protein
MLSWTRNLEEKEKEHITNSVENPTAKCPLQKPKRWEDNINPLPALTLQSARDLNVPCSQKRSKVLLLTKKNRIFFKKEEVFTFWTKTLNPLPVRLKVLLHALTRCVFQWHSRTTPEMGLPSRKKKIITIKLKKTEW